MAPNTATFFSRAWYGDEEITLPLPAEWQVETLAPRQLPALSSAKIRAAFQRPIGTAPISQLARGSGSAAIVVDDLSRPTPAAVIIPALLEELIAAGLPRDEIRFVVGGGSHRPLTREEIVKKVGAEVASRYEVTNHDFMSGHLRGVGNLPDGTPIFIDPVVADADFKVCLGGIYAHGAVGFGGGAKLILPGVSGLATMFCYHAFYPSRGHAVVEAERGDNPDHRHISEEVAGRVGLDVIVNAVLNHRREVAGLFVGDFIQAHRQAAGFALEAYGTAIPDSLRREADLLLVNCYPLDSDPIQTGKALWPRRFFDRAYTVAVNPASDGISYHGLFDRLSYNLFQTKVAQRTPRELPTPRIGKPDQVLILSEHFPVDEFCVKHAGDILFRHWEDLIAQLSERLPRRARVAVFPFAGIQVQASGPQS